MYVGWSAKVGIAIATIIAAMTNAAVINAMMRFISTPTFLIVGQRKKVEDPCPA